MGHAQSRAESGTCQMDECSPRSAAFPPHSPPTSGPSLFEWFIGTMPQCDSSVTYTRAVRPGPSPADLLPDWAAGVSEVSRFSCMKFLGVPWGLRPRRTEQKLALSLLPMLPSAHIYRVGVRIVCFRGSMSHPAYPLSTLRWVPHGSSARLEAKWIATPFL